MIIIGAALAAIGSAGLGAGGAPHAAARVPAASTVAYTQFKAVDAPTANPTTDRCTTPGHKNPCWATTQNATENAEGCTDDVPLIESDGGATYCLGGNDLVYITCYYIGADFSGDTYQDHVILENAGNLNLVGHIPDHFINLDELTPNELQPKLPTC